MLVNCRICGEKIDKNTAFKRIVSGQNWYCHSEEEYNKYQQLKNKAAEDKKRVTDEIEKIFGYPVKNSILWKEKKEWNSLKSDEIIAKYLVENEDYLIKAINRLPNIEYNRIRYFSAILKNSLHDFVPKIIVKEQPAVVQDFEVYQPKTVQKNNTRRSFDDLE